MIRYSHPMAFDVKILEIRPGTRGSALPYYTIEADGELLAIVIGADGAPPKLVLPGQEAPSIPT